MKYLNQEEDLKDLWVLDIETNGLQPDIIWCVCVQNLLTNQTMTFRDKKEFKDWYKGQTLVGHNIVSFDAYWLNRLWNAGIDYDSVICTMTLSYLYNPKLEGGHNLESYGHRLKFPKGGHSDWSQYSPEMLSYCQNDVTLTGLVYKALVKKMTGLGFSELSCKIEHQIRKIIDDQERHGFYFNRVGATSLRDDLRKRESDLAVPIQELFPSEYKELGTYTRRTRKDGGDYASYQRHVQAYSLEPYKIEDNGDGTYTTYVLEPFNIASPAQRLDRLLRLGYKPTAKTKKGNPKIDEDSLLTYAELSGRLEIKAMAEWLVLNGRANMIDTWLNHLGDDDRIHGTIMTCGAGSRRMIHNKPNTANVPHPKKAKYGKEVRELWCVEPGKNLIEVGCDAAGLENVGLLHYLDDRYRPEAIQTLAQEKPNDVHTMNARKLSEALGIAVDREWGSKTSYYATLYGCYPPKIAEILKTSKKNGEKAQDILLNSVPGLKELTEESQKEWDKNNGRLRTIDGGYVLCPSRSAALNYRVQSLGAIVMKLAQILLVREAKKEDLWFRFLGTIHDEFQMETLERDGDKLGKIACWCISEAARQLGFKLPLGGNYSLGYSWASCH